MSQTVQDRYRALRLTSRTAATALALARDAAKNFYYYPPCINRPFSADRQNSNDQPSNQYRWIDNVTRLGWRPAGYADEITAHIKHRGWYANTFFDEVYRGIVYRLPRGRFLYGYADPLNDDCALIANTTATTLYDAANRADRIAQMFAERDMEYSEAWQSVSAAVNQKRERRKDVMEALKDLRELETCDSPRIRTTIRSAFKTTWEAYRYAATQLAAASDNAAPYGISQAEF